MACFTTKSFNITGCTDANTYTRTATSVDFQMEGAATGGLTVFYKICLQKYDSYNGWTNWECKNGSFENQTGIIKFSLTNPRPPQGSYRIKVDCNLGQPGTDFSMVTTTIIIQ